MIYYRYIRRRQPEATGIFYQGPSNISQDFLKSHSIKVIQLFEIYFSGIKSFA